MTLRPVAAIFDLDGVLLDTEPLYTEATEAVVVRYGKHYTAHQKRFIMGRSPLEGARWLVTELGLPISAEQYLRARHTYLQVLFQDCPLIPGAAALVAELHRRGLRLALATSSERELCALKIRPYAWFSWFEAILCGDDPRLTRAKPAPDIYCLASAELGVTPRQCLVVEDSPAGVQAGVAAGMRVVARLAAPIERADLADAEQIMTSYDQLDWDRLLSGGDAATILHHCGQ